MPYQQNKEQLVQSYQERTVELQEKSRKIETMSDTEKHELSVEIETTLFDLKKDMEILDVTTDVSEKSQLVNFETQLTTMKNSLAVTSDTEITLEEVNLEDKSRYGKALDWIKEHPGWTALGVGTVGLGFLAYRWHKKRKAKEEAEKKQVSNTKNSSGQAPIVINTGEKKNRWQRNWGWVVGTAGLAGVGYAFRDKLYNIPYVGQWLDRLYNGKGLTMEEAKHYTESNVINKASEDHLTNYIRLVRDEEFKKLSTFGQEFDIDIDKKQIKGLDMKFRTFEELIAAAMIIGSAKHSFKGACANYSPFSISTLGGDIEVNLAKGSKDLVSGKGFPIGAVAGGVVGVGLGVLIGYFTGIKAGILSGAGLTAIGAGAGSLLLDHNDTLSKICPALNNKDNKAKFVSYLNSLGGWEPGRDDTLDEKAKTNNEKVNQTFVEMFEEIMDTTDSHDKTNTDKGNERGANISNYKNHPDIFELKTRGFPCYLKATLDNLGNVTSIEVEDTGIVFSGENAIKEAMHLGAFINKCEKEFAGEGRKREAFDARLSWDIYKKGIYFDKNWYDPYFRILGINAIKNNMPTLLQDKNMDTFIAWLNSRKDGKDGGESLWTKKNGRTGRTNTYLKSL